MRKGKTFKQQEKYYGFDNLCDSLLLIAFNGNFEDHDRIVKELKVKYRKDYLKYLLESEDSFSSKLIDRTINLI